MKLITQFLAFSLTFLFAFNLSAEEYGIASYYSDSFQGRKTASGERYDIGKLTAAHKSLPFGTIIKITRLDNKKSVRVRVNDRGPYIKGRIVDVSRKAAERLGIIQDGHAQVKVEVVGKGEVAPKAEPAVVTTPKPQPTTTPATRAAEFAERTTPKPVAKPTPKPQPTTVATKPSPAKTKVIARETAAPKPVKKEVKKVEEVAEAKLVTKDYQEYDLYKIRLMRPKKEGFGVQVASLSSYENVMKKVAELQGMWYKNILVSIEKGGNGSPIYKVIMGPFPDEEVATAYKKGMKKKNKLTGFVVPLENTGAAAQN
ncbi:MAG: septal ring lytic transglycosylase RlpA family protein [Saprospiraceae bacterium]